MSLNDLANIGQVVGAIESLPTVADVVASIVAEAEQTLARLGA